MDNRVKTFILLAGLTVFLVLMGKLIGGRGGMQIALVMADASGKSVQAAIYMAVVKALFLSQSQSEASPMSHSPRARASSPSAAR